MKSIGLTGGIGSGKSTVAHLLEGMGYRVYYADVRAKAIMEEDEQLADELLQAFGPGIWQNEGKLDRVALAEIVFHSKEKLALLNSLVHPGVARDFQKWIESIPKSYTKRLVFKEAAILFEAGSHKAADAVLTVYAPKSVRLARVQARDGVKEESVLARMRNQWPDAKKCLMSDFIIFNDGTHSLDLQVKQAVAYLEGLWR